MMPSAAERRPARARGRAAALVILLASAACQQSGAAGGGKGGMFEDITRGPSSGAANAGASANQQAAAPVPAPAPSSPLPTPVPTVVPAAPGPAAPASGPGVEPSAPATPRQEDRRLRINNRSGKIIREIRGSAASQHSYGPDRIPHGVLADGASVIVDFNDGNGECLYDLFVLFQDGSRRDQGGVNVCRATDLTILPTGAAVR